eukprot:66272_1
MATLTAILTMFSRIAFGAKYVFHDVLTLATAADQARLPTAAPTRGPTTTTSTLEPTKTTAQPTTTSTLEPTKTTAQPTTTTTQQNDAEVEDDTTTVPPNDDDEQSDDEMDESQGQNMEMTYIIVATTVVLCCLVLVCVFLNFLFWKLYARQKKEVAVLDEMPDTEVVEEAVASSYNDADEESAAVGSQQTGMQGMQSVATWNVNTIDNVQSNTEGNDSCDDVADGDGLHMVTAGAVAGHTHIVEAPKKESENALVCTDCGLKKVEKYLIKIDGLFYCWECWKVYE